MHAQGGEVLKNNKNLYTKSEVGAKFGNELNESLSVGIGVKQKFMFSP